MCSPVGTDFILDGGPMGGEFLDSFILWASRKPQAAGFA